MTIVLILSPLAYVYERHDERGDDERQHLYIQILGEKVGKKFSEFFHCCLPLCRQIRPVIVAKHVLEVGIACIPLLDFAVPCYRNYSRLLRHDYRRDGGNLCNAQSRAVTGAYLLGKPVVLNKRQKTTSGVKLLAHDYN